MRIPVATQTPVETTAVNFDWSDYANVKRFDSGFYSIGSYSAGTAPRLYVDSGVWEILGVMASVLTTATAGNRFLQLVTRGASAPVVIWDTHISPAIAAQHVATLHMLPSMNMAQNTTGASTEVVNIDEGMPSPMLLFQGDYLQIIDNAANQVGVDPLDTCIVHVYYRWHTG